MCGGEERRESEGCSLLPTFPFRLGGLHLPFLIPYFCLGGLRSPHSLLGWVVSPLPVGCAVSFRLFGWMVSPLPSWLGGLACLVVWEAPPPPVVWSVSPSFLFGLHFWLGGLPFSLFVGSKRKKKQEKRKRKGKKKNKKRKKREKRKKKWRKTEKKEENERKQKEEKRAIFKCRRFCDLRNARKPKRTMVR